LPVRPIVLYPDPRLKAICSGVSDMEQASRVARDLLDTMDAGPPRTVGIAAPQIGEMVRIALVDTSRNPKYPPGHGPLTLIDPAIVASEGVQLFREGCLSIPEFTANITRAMRVTVQAVGLDGAEIEVTAEGFESVVLQHEIDHLDGMLFLDRVKNIHADLFRRK
jgi:peptide deformylase